MIKKLIVKNFRCFENATIVFQETSILVGKNNAGKSTLIEALKIIATVVRKFKKLPFAKAPIWVPNETDNGVAPSIENQSISDNGLFNFYGNPPAIVEAFFSNGCSIRAYVGEGLSVFALIIKKDGIPVRNAKEAKEIVIPPIEVLPQISALLEDEKKLERKTVAQNKSTRLTSRNFRNQLFYYSDAFPQFKALVESTWEGLQVKPIDLVLREDGQHLFFQVRNNEFAAEIGWMGHGLQMWVQCMWFISQCSPDSVVILDEPDVYMHADLQRRLIRLVAPKFSQLIIATHSVEIMEEVLPENIIHVDSKRRIIKSVGNHELLQQLLEGMGSAFNLDMARLFISKRFLIWEGPDTDRMILSKFQSVLYPQGLQAIGSFPKTYVEGWGGWQKAIAIASVFNHNQVHVKCYCIFDSDYHTPEEIVKRKFDAKNRHINLHIWEKKEIENYAIQPEVLFRYFQAKKRKGKITMDILLNKISEIENGLKEEVQDGIASEIQKQDKSLDYSTVRKQADKRMKELWVDAHSIVPGKEFFKRLATWAKTEYGFNLQVLGIIPYFRPEDIPLEMKEVIIAIVNGEEFS